MSAELDQAFRSMRAKKTYVYFILALGLDAVKVGYTNNIKKRLEVLQVGSPVELAVAAAIEAPMRCEASLHKILSVYHVRGEWFKLTDEVIDIMEKAKETGEHGIDLMYMDYVDEQRAAKKIARRNKMMNEG